MAELFGWISAIDLDWPHVPSPYAIVLVAVASLLCGIVFLINKYFFRDQCNIHSVDLNVNESTAYQQTLQFVKALKREHALDAIIVCGGGRPSTITAPPLYVQSRCDVSVLLYNHTQTHFGKDNAPKILCLSAGTAHTPQLLHKASKLPVWESYASAQYILHKYSSFVKPTDVYMETVSYDTIGNAYFAKRLFSDVLEWKHIAVITNDWHFARTKAIFEWIYSLTDEQQRYHLTFVNVRALHQKDLSQSARQARLEREQKSLKNVYRLQAKYNSLRKVHDFLHTEHSMYACAKIADDEKKDNQTQENAQDVSSAASKLMAAYGYTRGGNVDQVEMEQHGDIGKAFQNVQNKLEQKQARTSGACKEKTTTI